jgi:SAM-dependent methyltransferase
MTDMTDISKATCLLCEGRSYGNLQPTGKKPHDRNEAQIVVCKLCGHIQMWPLLPPEEESLNYDNDQRVRLGIANIARGSDFEAMRIKFAEWTREHVDMYFDVLQRYDNVLEIGAGYGFFMEALNACPERNFSIEGVEIGRFRLDHFCGGVVHNVNVLTDDIPAALNNKFDCIICMHVLEHIGHPVQFLRKIKLFLKPGGSVIFEVPNINCFLGELSAKYKDFMYIYEHCSYFFADTLRLVFEKAGYCVESVSTREIYSIENHCRWVRDGVPFTKFNQMFMPDERLEWINRLYKDEIGRQGKGFALIVQANAGQIK